MREQLVAWILVCCHDSISEISTMANKYAVGVCIVYSLFTFLFSLFILIFCLFIFLYVISTIDYGRKWV